MHFLRPKYYLIQSTAATPSPAYTVQFGPFVDAGDGVTLEVGLAAAMNQELGGIRVSKAGGVFVDRNNATIPAYDAMGFYQVALSTADTETLGILRLVFVNVACRPLAQDFMVLPNIYRPMQSSGGVYHGELTRS